MMSSVCPARAREIDAQGPDGQTPANPCHRGSTPAFFEQE